MMDSIKNLLGIGPSLDFAKLISDGAMIVDVRTRGEFAAGHVKGSVNIPLDQLQTNLSRFPNKEQVIITCCASGMRSGAAKSLLKGAGYVHVHNGGPWSSVRRFVQ